MGGMVLLLLGQSIGKMIGRALVFQKDPIALGSPKRYEFIPELKKMNGSGKREQEHVPHSCIKSENKEVSGPFHVVAMQLNGKEMYKKLCCN